VRFKRNPSPKEDPLSGTPPLPKGKGAPAGAGNRLFVASYPSVSAGGLLGHSRMRQSLQRIQWPFGYSNSHDPSNSKPSLLQMPFDGALSTDGNA
jgi:hypothetical protein